MTAPDTDTLAGLREELRLIGCHQNGDARCTCSIGADALDAIDALEAQAAKDKARIERLEAALREAAMDCETAVKVEYGWPNVHPAMQPKFDRDMSEIAGWRAALEDGE